MSEWPVAELSDEVLDSLRKLTQLDNSDPIFNREFVKMRVEHAIERYRRHEGEIEEDKKNVKSMKRVTRLCEELESAICELDHDATEFIFLDHMTPVPSVDLLTGLPLLRQKLETILDGIYAPLPPGRPTRGDSRDFVRDLVETFYLVDGGRKSGRGCTKYRRLLDFLTICIEEAGVQGAPAILEVKDSAWKKYVAPAITSTRVSLPQSRKLYEGLHRVSVRQEGAVAPS